MIDVDQNRKILTLAFHVDYWNHLHWKDPYSHAVYTQRQYHYAKTIANLRVYTPQMIVNGQYGFVGSRRDHGFYYIGEVLKESPPHQIMLNINSVTKTHIDLGFSVEPPSDSGLLQLALVEGGIVRKIHSGENSGRTLTHENVVRDFKTIPLKARMKRVANLKIPHDLVRENSAIIAYLQHPKSWKVLGAQYQKW